jgi:DnaJ-class molecular chaperone
MPTTKTTTKTTQKSETSSLQKLYRQVAKAMHPDLGTDDKDRARRNTFMARANEAYEKGSEASLKTILHDFGVKDAVAHHKATADADGKVKAEEVKTTKVKAPKTPKVAKVKKMSGLDAVAEVLKGRTKPMTLPDIFKEMVEKGIMNLGGKTPIATLNSAIHAEMKKKGKDSRFAKAGVGLFILA